MNSNRMRVYVNNSFHLRRKYLRVFVRGHHLFRDANSLFNVQRKMHEHLFAPNEALCDYYPSNIFATHWKKMLTDSLLFTACGMSTSESSLVRLCERKRMSFLM